MTLPGELSRRCFQLLIRFDDFDSHQSLKSIFIKAAELKAYASDLPEASNRRDRVNKVMAFLLDKYSSKGSVFVLFLNELFSQVPKEDERYTELKELVPLVAIALSSRDYEYRKVVEEFDYKFLEEINNHNLPKPSIAPGKSKSHAVPSVYSATGAHGARLFLSYARHDYEQVRPIYLKLKEAGFNPWMDEENIFGGETFDLAIASAIKTADFFLFFLSPYSASRRGFLQREIKLALDQWQERMLSDIYLIPLRLEACETPEELSRFQCIDMFEEDGWRRLLGAIQEGLRRLGRT
jgi:hypothetical protein